ncbi:hypothetical protein B0H19DRAFT_1084557 [Mycena capillaripes]|nr:hypothetical protein B0H19DRAFT_1084557 [Mycena capillaripes]
MFSKLSAEFEFGLAGVGVGPGLDGVGVGLTISTAVDDFTIIVHIWFFRRHSTQLAGGGAGNSQQAKSFLESSRGKHCVVGYPSPRSNYTWDTLIAANYLSSPTVIVGLMSRQVPDVPVVCCHKAYNANTLDPDVVEFIAQLAAVNASALANEVVALDCIPFSSVNNLENNWYAHLAQWPIFAWCSTDHSNGLAPHFHRSSVTAGEILWHRQGKDARRRSEFGGLRERARGEGGGICTGAVRANGDVSKSRRGFAQVREPGAGRAFGDDPGGIGDGKRRRRGVPVQGGVGVVDVSVRARQRTCRFEGGRERAGMGDEEGTAASIFADAGRWGRVRGSAERRQAETSSGVACEHGGWGAWRRRRRDKRWKIAAAAVALAMAAAVARCVRAYSRGAHGREVRNGKWPHCVRGWGCVPARERCKGFERRGSHFTRDRRSAVSRNAVGAAHGGGAARRIEGDTQAWRRIVQHRGWYNTSV